jgi:hypothetical protein
MGEDRFCAEMKGSSQRRPTLRARSSAVLSLALVGSFIAGLFATGAQASTFEFPSSASTVVSSGATLSGQVGYFWSQARGDKVSQTFVPGVAYIDHVQLAVQSPQNALNGNNEVDWALLINGTEVGSFAITPGATGPTGITRSFAPIAGPAYAVELRVTNEVPSGGGSVSLAVADTAGAHSIDISNEPSDTTLTGGPEGSTPATSASFDFASSQGDTTGFQCSLDHLGFVPCSSPASYGGLAPGAHSFEVRAVDAGGLVDPTPATRQWTVLAATVQPKPLKCRKGFKKAKRHGKTVCVKKHRKKHHHHHKTH